MVYILYIRTEVNSTAGSGTRSARLDAPVQPGADGFHMRARRMARITLTSSETEPAYRVAKPAICLEEAIWPEPLHWAGELPTQMVAPPPVTPVGWALADDPNRLIRRHAWTDFAFERTARYRPLLWS